MTCDKCIIKDSEIERLQLALAETERLWREEVSKNKSKSMKIPPVGWMTRESLYRLTSGGNSSRGSVPVHANKSKVAYIGIHVDEELID